MRSDLDAAHAIARATTTATEADRRFDAVVIGAGAAGGLAAEILTQRGLKVLLLDAGRRRTTFEAPLNRLTQDLVRYVANPASLPFMPAWALYKGRMALRLLGRHRQPVQTACYAWERMPQAFVDDLDCPYTTPQDRPFLWLRARILGGRMVIPGHGRQYLRFGQDDFAPQDGASPPWPFAGRDLDPWYETVERRLGLRGARDAIPWTPDSEITHPISPSTAEAQLIARIRGRWPQSRPILGRFAPPPDTIATAALTDNLTIRQGAIARAIDVADGRVRGVFWVDSVNGENRHVVAPLVFLCASALESTRILLLSVDETSRRGLGAASGVLGRNLMDHVMLKAEGVGPSLPTAGPNEAEDGRCLYLPRFDSRQQTVPTSARGFGVQVYQTAIGGGRSFFTAVSFSEMLPRSTNRVTIDPSRRDRWKIPALHIDCAYGAPELALAEAQSSALSALADVAGAQLSRLDRSPGPPGSAVHECGTARMGSDPQSSVLDSYNQCWDAAGLYVTDSSSFPSQGSQNPTLTVMALTARACAHAVAGSVNQG